MSWCDSHPLWSQVGCILTSPLLPIPFYLSPTVPHFKYMPSYDDIAISASHSPIQIWLLAVLRNPFMLVLVAFRVTGTISMHFRRSYGKYLLVSQYYKYNICQKKLKPTSCPKISTGLIFYILELGLISGETVPLTQVIFVSLFTQKFLVFSYVLKFKKIQKYIRDKTHVF
jgi:hypothetical protein